jgi:hypothetical protein
MNQTYNNLYNIYIFLCMKYITKLELKKYYKNNHRNFTYVTYSSAQYKEYTETNSQGNTVFWYLPLYMLPHSHV